MYDDDESAGPTKRPKRVRLRDVRRVRLRDVFEEEVDEEPYRVGYKFPPLHSRFKKGQSGNPSGKRKAEVEALDIRSLVQDTFLANVKVREAGKKVKLMPKLLALIKQKLQEAIKDPQAFRDMMRLAEKFDVFKVHRKAKMKPSNMTPEQLDAAAKAYRLLQAAGLTKIDDKEVLGA